MRIATTHQVPRKTPSTKRATGVDALIRKAISRAKDGKIFSAADFSEVGNRAAVDKVLSRLATQGTLRRLARGLYDVPQEHAILGPLLPTANNVANALASKLKLRLQPTGSYAANLLGLTEQVPVKLTFLTDGPSKTVQVAGQTFVLKHTTPKNMATAGRVSGLVIQALRHLKKENVTEEAISSLKAKLSRDDKIVLLQDVSLAPLWIADIMRGLAQEEA